MGLRNGTHNTFLGYLVDLIKGYMNMKWTFGDSNPGLTAYEAVALTF